MTIMTMMTRLASLTVMAAMTLEIPAAAAQNAEVMTWKVGDDTRQAIVYAPRSANVTGARTPLIFSFHGHGDDMENFQYTDLHKAWPEAIVVYFQGLPSRRDGYPGWQTEQGQDEDRDLKLVDAALASLRGQFKVDDARVYATGFSNGANFTYLLWAERPEIFAAYAPVAARLRPSVRPTHRKPLLHVAGVRDAQIPFADQKRAIDVALRVDGFSGRGESCGVGCTIYGSATPAPVMTWFHPGGHSYPNETSERIAQFFREHQLN